MRDILFLCISVIFVAGCCYATDSGEGPIRQPRPGGTRPQHSFGFVSEIDGPVKIECTSNMDDHWNTTLFLSGTSAAKHFYRYPIWTCGYEYGDRFINQMDVYGGEKGHFNNWFFFREDGIYNRTGFKPEEFVFQLDRKWLTNETPVPEFECTKEGKFRDPKDCAVFHVCQAYEGGFVHDKFNCPQGTVYCESQDICGWETDCPCSN